MSFERLFVSLLYAIFGFHPWDISPLEALFSCIVRRFFKRRLSTIRLQENLVGVDWFGDVLDLLLPEVLVSKWQLVFNLVIRRTGYANPARLGNPFQSRGNVYPIPVNPVPFSDDIAQVDTYGNSILRSMAS